MMENMINTMTRKSSRMTYAQAGELNGVLPPQAVELEKSVLGALMLDQDTLYGHIDKIHEGLFYKAEHQVIFAAIKTLVNGLKDVDLLTVVEELKREGKLELAGGSYNVSQLTANVVSAAHIDRHIQILAEKFIQREVIRTSTESIMEAYDETCDALELIDKSQKKLMEVSEMSFRKDGLAIGSIISDAKELLFSKEADEYSIPSGFTELDRLTSGFQPGTLIILAARPGMGKTACGLCMARNMAVDFKKPVAFFSLEMTGVELMLRLMSSESMIEARKLKRSANLKKEEKLRLFEKMTELSSAPIYIDDTPGLNIFELRAKCRRMKQKYGIKMVFIDYLQIMGPVNDGNRTRNREQELSVVSRQLKEMSKELNIPVLAMAQFNRKVDDRPMQIPLLSDLRESGSLEQDADMVIAIHRLEKCGIMVDENGNSTEGMATLRIMKHRAGEIGNIDVRFEGKYVKFSNPPMTEPVIVDSAMTNEYTRSGFSRKVRLADVVVDSAMNKEIVPNTDFDNPAHEMQVDNDGNPIFPDGGLPPIDDNTPPPFVPGASFSQGDDIP